MGRATKYLAYRRCFSDAVRISRHLEESKVIVDMNALRATHSTRGTYAFTRYAIASTPKTDRRVLLQVVHVGGKVYR